MNLQPSSIHIIILVLLVLFMIPISDASPIYYSYGTETEFNIVMTIPLVFNSLNLLGTLYIFYRTFLRWKYGRKSISLSLRFPFYIAITDFLYSSAIIINMSYSASNKSKFLNKDIITWPSPVCEIIGFCIILFVLLNILLVGAISITTWLRVVQEYYFNLGKYDYKIWLPIVFISLIIPLSTLNSYGSHEYVCGTKDKNIIASVLVFVIIIVTLLTIVFCYAHIMKTIRDIKDDNSSITNSKDNSTQLTTIERKTFKKVLTYILVFILQYVPILFYNFCKFLKIRHILLFALSPSVISFGGIGNIIQYLCNEGLKQPPSKIDYDLEADKLQSNSNSVISE